ncbi:MAG: hypothetical protein JJT75_00485 [Opitutales bacterium]|nr:hypothetical protein [Opitutales bacterium]MCH8539290.1 hypothetical protein [Opitutales bacterium]
MSKGKKILGFLSLLSLTILLLVAVDSLPKRGLPDAPAHQVINAAGNTGAGAYFIQSAYEDAATPNMVTVVLGDYRSFDTLGEVVVVFAAAIACYLILRRREDEEK